MREILFRGKRLDNGELVYGLLTIMWGEYHIISRDNENVAYPVDPSTVGQYTGLKDKNGKRIFEGDIVTGMVHGPGIWTGQVIWIDRIAGFGLKWIHRDDPTAFEKCSFIRFLTSQGGHPDEYLAEIIGNIHDNKNLA